MPDDASCVRQAVEGSSEALVADAERGPQVVSGEGATGQRRQHVRLQAGGGVTGGIWWVDDLEVRVVGLLASVQPQVEDARCWGGAVLGREGDGVLVAVEIEARVGPSVEVAGAAEIRSGPTRAAVLAATARSFTWR